jgi:hypothetical protein
MAKPNTIVKTHEEEFPSQLLYSSPPEVSTLRAWVQDVEAKQTQRSVEVGPSNDE